MAVLFFSEDKKAKLNRLIVFILAMVMTVIGLWFVSADITTTGKWYDSIGLQPVLPPQTVFSVMSTEGGLFGIFLSLFQVYLGYKIVMENNAQRKRMYWGLYLFTALFDTYTDTDFRSFSFKSPALAAKSLMVSFFLYNLGSEWAVGTGLRELWVNLPLAIDALRDLVVTEHRKPDQRPSMQPLQRPSSGSARPLTNQEYGKVVNQLYAADFVTRERILSGLHPIDRNRAKNDLDKHSQRNGRP